MRPNLRSLLAGVAILGLAGCSQDHTLPNAPESGSVVNFNISAGTGSISGRVFDDVNQNHIQDPEEPGMPGITVTLFLCDDTEVASMLSGPNGGYAFEGTSAGNYYIAFSLFEGYEFTMPNDGDDDCFDSDVYSIGKTICFAHDEGEQEPCWDAGQCALADKGEEPGEGCRVTGGGVDEFGNWDGSMGGKAVCERDRYQFGGQAGANTGAQPQPKGEWTHHQQNGPSGSFLFHAGTASAPDGTEIDLIQCSDPGFCNPARPAPTKQIDFWGVGTFKNMRHTPDSISNNVTVGSSLHWFEVNIDDAGEPGKGKQGTDGCPEFGFGLNGDPVTVDCDCPDFYRITIYEGPTDASPVMYTVWGYITGNLQIHPVTGFDSN